MANKQQIQERLYVRGLDLLDPVKAEAIFEEILDWLEAQGHVFAPEPKRKFNSKPKGK